jgi:hypothetical protein
MGGASVRIKKPEMELKTEVLDVAHMHFDFGGNIGALIFGVRR